MKIRNSHTGQVWVELEGGGYWTSREDKGTEFDQLDELPEFVLANNATTSECCDLSGTCNYVDVYDTEVAFVL